VYQSLPYVLEQPLLLALFGTCFILEHTWLKLVIAARSPRLLLALMYISHGNALDFAQTIKEWRWIL
jgi:hypothetical protein